MPRELPRAAAPADQPPPEGPGPGRPGMELPDPVRQRLSNLSLTVFGDSSRTGPESTEAAGEWRGRRPTRGCGSRAGERPHRRCPGERWRLRLQPGHCPQKTTSLSGRSYCTHSVARSPRGLGCGAGSPASPRVSPLRPLRGSRPLAGRWRRAFPTPTPHTHTQAVSKPLLAGQDPQLPTRQGLLPLPLPSFSRSKNFNPSV